MLAPVDDYSVTKAAADLAVGALSFRSLRCIRFRPFNHTGPGQTEDFVIPSFAMQIARIEAGLAAPSIRVGNLDAERDFLDVRDVVAAYALAVKRVSQIPSGAILNLASGAPRRIRDVLDQLISLSSRSIAVEHEASRLRAADLPCIVGDASLAHRTLGWSPRYRFEETLRDILTHCRTRQSYS